MNNICHLSCLSIYYYALPRRVWHALSPLLVNQWTRFDRRNHIFHYLDVCVAYLFIHSNDLIFYINSHRLILLFQVTYQFTALRIFTVQLRP